jgi:hypothetical protein
VEQIYSLLEWIKKAIVPFSPKDEATWGQLGDWIGGTGGTIVTLASFVALLFTLKLSRAAMTRQGVYAIFAAMSKTHDDLTASFQMFDSKGADVFKILLSDFNVCLKATVKHYPELGTRETVDVAYTLFFYGSTLAGRESLKETYAPVKINAILNDISTKRNRLTQRYPEAKGHRLSGNQARLSNYYRNLYAIYTFIDESDLPAGEKRSILKTMRTKMNNHEQALLALNICSHLGAKWEHEKLLTKYEPIKNIPRAFLTLPNGDALEDLFPEINFEFEDHQKRRTTLLNFEYRGFSASIKIKRTSLDSSMALNIRTSGGSKNQSMTTTGFSGTQSTNN